MSEAALESVKDKSRLRECSEYMEVPFDDEGNLCLYS